MAAILNDPRFKLARSLVTGGSSDANKGGPSDAINIFAALLEECRSINETSLSSALCQFEYGNSIFRAVVRRKSDDNSNGKEVKIGSDTNSDNDKKPAAKIIDNGQREVMAAAALKRSAAADGDELTTSSPNKRAKMDASDTSSSMDRKVVSSSDVASSNVAAAKTNKETDIDEEDIQLALDMMQEAWSILLTHTTITDDSTKSDKTNPTEQQRKEQEQWVLEQIPRVIRCIGDVYFFQEQYALATDSYIRAMQYREENWDKLKQQSASSTDDVSEMLTLQHLQCQRHLVEAYALVAEALLACPSREDVVCYHSDEDDGDNDESESLLAEAKKKTGGTVLCKAKDRMEFAQSHYESAREGLEEILMRYGKMAASSNVDVGNEKEDIGYLVMTVVDVGQTIQGQN